MGKVCWGHIRFSFFSTTFVTNMFHSHKCLAIDLDIFSTVIKVFVQHF